MAFRDIRNNVQEITAGEMLEVCLRLIDEVEKHDTTKWTCLTHALLSSWVRIPASNPVFQNSLLLLSTAKDAKLFDTHFLVFDPADPDDLGTFVPDDEMVRAFNSGVLYHPETGMLIAEFEKHISPCFTLGREVRASQT